MSCKSNIATFLLFKSIFILAIFAGFQPLLAHDNSGAVIFVDVRSESVKLELEIPLNNLRHELNNPAQGLIVEFPSPRVDEYIGKHVSVYFEDRQPFPMTIESKEIVTREGKDFQKIEAIAKIPAGSSSRNFILDSDVIIHNRSDKHVLVFLRNDFESGKIGSVNFVNELSPNSHALRFHLKSGTWLMGFEASVLLGMQHIAEGTDHLLFLFTLLLTAGLMIRPGKIRSWGKVAGPSQTAKAIFMIVSAFTFGHSLTLLLGALGYNSLPSQLVESAIAFSILLTATHAIFPIFPKKEAWVAFAFGLIHGLGFASAIGELGVEGHALLLTILGFSLGIELMQALLIILILPMIYSLHKGRFGKILRAIGGLLAVAMASAWLIERLMARELEVLKTIDETTVHGLWLLPFLLALVLFSRVFDQYFEPKLKDIKALPKI